MLVVEHKVAYDGSSEQSREGEKVGNGVDVFMWGQIRQSLYDLLAESLRAVSNRFAEDLGRCQLVTSKLILKLSRRDK